MATITIVEPSVGSRTVLRGVPWSLYSKLRDLEENNHVRMTYHDGMLIFMSPEIRHEVGAELLALLVRSASIAFGFELMGIRSTTLRRKGSSPMKGSGKEPDNAYYIGPNERLMRNRQDLDLSVDPPPDLAIEVDNSGDSRLSLRVYARIGVQELWVYKARERSLWFGRLQGNSYAEIGHSLSLPRLTPALVIRAINAKFDGDMGENAWGEWVRDWARTLPEPPAT